MLSAESLIFDSYKTQIQIKHLLATIGYPQYGFPWVEVNEGVYIWDGSLLSNTPIREVMMASLSNDKNIFVIENYPKKKETSIKYILLYVSLMIRDDQFLVDINAI